MPVVEYISQYFVLLKINPVKNISWHMRNRVKLKSSIVLEDRQIALTHTLSLMLSICVYLLFVFVSLSALHFLLSILSLSLSASVCLHCCSLYIYIDSYTSLIDQNEQKNKPFPASHCFPYCDRADFLRKKIQLRTTELHFTLLVQLGRDYRNIFICFFFVLIKGLTNLHDNFFPHSGYKCFLSYAIDLLYTLCQLNEVTWPMADPPNGYIYTHRLFYKHNHSVLFCVESF